MRVAVAGGGITGLVAALRLQDSGADTTLFEASERLGGKIHTIPLGHAHIEEGPDALLPRSAHPFKLFERIGLDDLVSPATFGAVIPWRGRLHPVPSGTYLGVPMSPRAVREADMLSRAGKARALLEYAHVRPLRGDDVALGSFVRSRFGRQVLERMVDPLLAGTRAGGTEEMSLAAAAREIDEAARMWPSLLRRTRGLPPQVAVVAATGTGTGSFVAPRGGMSQLVDTLAAALTGVDVRLSSPVEELTLVGGGLVVNGEQFDRTIVTLPSPAAARVLEVAAPASAQLLRRITHGSGAVVNLSFAPGSIDLPPQGSGLLIPSRVGSDLSAATWFTRKWPHVRPRDGSEIVRLFGAREGGSLLQMDDDALTTRLLEDLARYVRVGKEPDTLSVRRWNEGLPQLKVGHLGLVAEIRKRLPAQVHVAGTDLDGTGIPDCIRQANRAVAEALGSHD